MTFRSIRSRLQIYYGLVMVCVLAGFGVTAYYLERNRQWREVDEQLLLRATALLPVYFPPGPRRAESSMPPEGRFNPNNGGPPRAGRGEAGPGGPPFGQPGQGRFGPPPPRNLFAEGETNGFYFVIWERGGEEIDHSAQAPPNVPMPISSPGTEAKSSRLRGPFREAYRFTPPGDCVLVGRKITAEMAELRRFALGLTLVGAVVLAVGLVGGGWMANRAIGPIETISATAARIAAGDLSQRIALEDPETELGRLTTVLNATFARLEAAFAQQGLFTADAVQELRASVTTILNHTQMALARERTAVEFRKTVEACQRAAERMDRMMQSLLELTRLDTGQETMRRERFNLSKSVRDAMESLRPLAGDHSVTVQCEMSEVDGEGDPERIGQVVTHLLKNAIENSRPEGQVRVSAAAKTGMVELSVADAGQGIPEKDLELVFRPFYRGGKTGSPGPHHTGLGLALCKAIVDAHGGSIQVASQAGVGSTFTVRLPMETRA